MVLYVNVNKKIKEKKKRIQHHFHFFFSTCRNFLIFSSKTINLNEELLFDIKINFLHTYDLFIFNIIRVLSLREKTKAFFYFSSYVRFHWLRHHGRFTVQIVSDDWKKNSGPIRQFSRWYCYVTKSSYSEKNGIGRKKENSA